MLAGGVWCFAGTAWSRPLRVAYTHWFACVPLGIADDQQYWHDAGIDVQLRGYQTSQEVIAAISAGEVDIGYDMLATWVDVAQHGAPIAIVAETDWSNGGDKLLVRNGVTLAQQKSRLIAVNLRSSATMLFLREALAREHLGIADFRIIEVPEQEKSLELFKEGKVDTVVTNEPWASRIAAAGGKIVATTADFPGVAPEGFAVRVGQVEDEKLQSFFKAWFRAVAFMHDPRHAAEVANIASIYAFAGTEAITPADVANYAKITPIHDAATALRNNDLDHGNVRELIQRFTVLRRLQGAPVAATSLDNLFYLTPLRTVAASIASTATVATSAP